MSETVEKKLPVRNLERIGDRKFQSYEAAAAARAILTVQPMSDTTKALVAQLAKAKIFRRNDGTFDLVFYKKIGAVAPVKAAQAHEKAPETKEKAVHGLKSKDRKKSPKKAR